MKKRAWRQTHIVWRQGDEIAVFAPKGSAARGWGPLYTRAEWERGAAAAWHHDTENGLTCNGMVPHGQLALEGPI